MLPSNTSERELPARIYSKYDNGDVLYIKQDDRGELCISTLHKNIGLICDRGCKLQEINNFFISTNIIDLHIVGSGSYIFPLFIKI